MTAKKSKKKVDFDSHCPRCEHWECIEEKEPCSICLEHLYGTTDMPVKWKGRDEHAKL